MVVDGPTAVVQHDLAIGELDRLHRNRVAGAAASP